MAERMQFRPKADLLTLEEVERLCRVFARLGVRKIRLTGGEPLVRRNLPALAGALGGMVAAGALDEVTLTTNGTRLAGLAAQLAAGGIRRVNVSLDTLDPATFRAVTRRGDLGLVLDGLAAAKAAGLAVKINAVALKGITEGQVDRLIAWCGEQGFDLCLIEAMPLGDVEHRLDRFLPLSLVRRGLERRWTLVPTDWRSGGPARYVTVAETGRRLGFITPLSDNFCAECNRVRLTCTGILYTCLGQQDCTDLRAPLREAAGDDAVEAAIAAALAGKPKGRDFCGDRSQPAPARHMSVTGG